MKISKEQKDELKNHIKNGGYITVRNVGFFKRNNIYYISNKKYINEIMARNCMNYVFLDLIKDDEYKSVSESKFYSLLYRLSAIEIKTNCE